MSERDPHLDELLGAFELDALDDDERADVAAYLERSPEARREADRLGAAVAAMAAASVEDAPPPSHLWERIRHAMHGERVVDGGDRVAGEAAAGALPPLRLPPPAGPRAPTSADRSAADLAPVVPLHRDRWWPKLAAVAAVVALALGIGVTAGRLSSGDRSGEVSLDRLATAALADPDARVGTLVGEGAPGVRAVVDTSGRGYLLAADLPSLPPGRTYQLWGVDGEAPVSLAVLGPDPGVVAFPAGAGVSTLAITDELAPGAVAPGQAPLVVGQVS